MDDHVNGKSNISTSNEPAILKRRNIRHVSKQYGAFVGGFLICFGPFMAMITLQSSINIEESVGTLAMGIAYAMSVVMGLIVSPIAIRRIGTKWVMILGEITYVVYIGANLYPKRNVMIVAGILLGIGEAFVWTVLPMYLWHFGYSHSTWGTKGFETYVRKYTGMFYAVLQCAQIFGNSLSYGILYGSKSKNQSEYLNHLFFNESQQTGDAFKYCGANDCQDPNMTTQHISQYIPINSMSLYILIGTFCLLCICGVILHIYYLPRATTRHTEVDINGDPLLKMEATKEKSEKLVVSHDGKKNLSYSSTIVATFKHATTLKQMLLVPLLLYIGLENTIILAELSRSYISCILGVEQIGIVIIPFAIVSAGVSLLVPKAIEKFGRNGVMAVVLILDLCNYTFCLLWLPQEENKYLLILIFLEIAISEPTWKNCSLDVYTQFFPQDQEISYAVWNAWITIGIAVGFLWSPLFCVSSKLFIQIGMVLASMTFYVLAEYFHRKTSKSSTLPATDL